MIKKIFSIQSKFFLALLVLGIAVIGINSYFNVRSFQKDKLQQIYEMNLSQNRAIAYQLQAEITGLKNSMGKILRQLIYFKNESVAKRLFLDDLLFLNLKIYESSTGVPLLINTLSKATHSELEDQMDLVKQALVNEVAIHKPTLKNSSEWILALRFDLPNQAPYVGLATVTFGHFIESLGSNNEISNTLVLNEKGQKLIETPNQPNELDSFWLNLASMGSGKFTDSMTSELSGKSNQWIVATTGLGLANLLVTTLTDKRLAEAPIYFLIIKSIIIFFGFVLVLIPLSLLLSQRLTSNIEKLSMAAKEVKEGNLEARVNIQSKDELEELGENFNQMTSEITRLLAETAEKARMESELAMAQTVQENLFPKPQSDYKNLSINGYYQSASECGGDWWFYFHRDNHTYLLIGDATGHGAPAALVTAAAKSSAVMGLSKFDGQLDEILWHMNNSIFETSCGLVNMTFFLARFDHQSLVLDYSRASHDPPIILPSQDRPINRRKIKSLLKTNGRRLGEMLNSEYETASIQLRPGDQIFCFTDGITELMNSESKMFGERRLYQLLTQAFNENNGTNLFTKKLVKELNEFRGKEALHDDVTFFTVDIRGGASNV